eukprot:TRINITY_DN7320_c0_g1_i1.p1 TRINITY_DN7320_c0_g1~~TRINITY_DN7320_c0_g1_i1.p1  ORF type:complete len:303 (-),score=68.16 TRINITY_DN7320_c0_g1_i1:21-929(-)
MDSSSQHSRTIVVTNVSPETTEKKLTDFFTFCGRVESLSLVSHLTETADSAPKTAIIIFASEDAAQTALLLTNAHFVDRAIKVTLLSDLDPATAELFGVSPATIASTVTAENIQQKEFQVPDSERSKTSVVASLVAAGYVLGEDVFKKAKEYDDKHMISLHVKVGAQVIKAKAQQLDEEYKISERVEAVKNAAVQHMQKIDEKLKFSDTAASVAQTVSGTVSELAQKALQNENVAKGVAKLSALTDSIKDSVQREKAEIERAIREKQGAQPQLATGSEASGDVQTTTAPESSTSQPTTENGN